MRVYCTSKNVGTHWDNPYPVKMLYLGTSLKEAMRLVGYFAKHAKPETHWPAQNLGLYTALPTTTNPKMLDFFQCGNTWMSIFSFELTEES